MSSKNFPFQHTQANNTMVSDSQLAQVELAKRREYLLHMLSYDTDTVISMQQLEDEFNLIKSKDGI